MGVIVLEWCAKNQSATPDHQFHERYLNFTNALSDFELVSMPGMPKTVARNCRQLEMTMGPYGGSSPTRSRTRPRRAASPAIRSLFQFGAAERLQRCAGRSVPRKLPLSKYEGLLQENLPAAMKGRHLRSRDLRGRQLRAHAVRRAHKGLQFLERHEARQRL